MTSIEMENKRLINPRPTKAAAHLARALTHGPGLSSSVALFTLHQLSVHNHISWTTAATTRARQCSTTPFYSSTYTYIYSKKLV